MLATPTGAITASQIGAQKINIFSNTYNSGVFYGSENSTGWNQIYDVNAIVYLGNASFTYVSTTSSNMDAIAIGVGLSPINPTQTILGNVPTALATSVYVGITVEYFENGSYGIYAFVGNAVSQTKILSSLKGVEATIGLINYENGTFEYVVSLTKYGGNILFVGGYGNWPFSNYNSYTASILIEPESGYSYPLVSGGLIENFGFNYLYNGQVYSGPGTPVSGTSFYADILQGITATNVYITLVNGWGSTGSWSYLFQFYNTNNGQSTYGL